MFYRSLIFLLLVFLVGCARQPEIIPNEVVDLSYDELKINYNSCAGKGVMSSKGTLPWKLNYSFTTQNDSSYIQFRDIFGRRVLFVQALPSKITLWDMQKNLQYDSNVSNSIPIFNIMETYDIAQILWGEIPNKYLKSNEESGFERNSNLVNFKSSITHIGMVLDRIAFNLDSIDTIIEFKISKRDYGETNLNLLKGIPEQVPLN